MNMSQSRMDEVSKLAATNEGSRHAYGAHDSETLRRVLYGCFDRLRATSLSSDEGVVAVTQLLAWLKLSDSEIIPVQYQAPHTGMRVGLEQFEDAEDFFRKSPNDLWVTAFTGMSNRFRALDSYTIHELVGRVSSLATTEKADYTVLAESLLSEWYPNHLFSLIPNEVAELGMRILDIAPQDSVYCPFVGSLRFALACADKVEKVFVELPHRDQFMASILVLVNANIEVRFSDPILSPAYLDGRKLRQFDVSFACGAFNLKRQLPDFDVFGRFAGKMAFSDVVDAQHIISQSARRAVSVVASGLLSRNGIAERQFREEVVMSGLLRAVIALPDGLLTGTNIPVNLLVFDKKEHTDSIVFIDARSEQFFEPRKERRGSKNRLTGIESITELFSQPRDGVTSRIVSREECRNRDFDLSVGQYVISNELAVLQGGLDTGQHVPLERVTSLIIRGQSPPVGEDKIQLLFYEIGAADIGPDGIVRTPKKEVFVDEKDLHGAFSKQILRPGDIVMAVKGSVGTVGRVEQDGLSDDWSIPMIRVLDGTDVTLSPSVVPAIASTNWIVGQSYVLIRANEQIDPIVLFMYLRSKVAQSWIKSKATGTTVPNLQKQYIQSLPVILPSLEEQASIKARYSQIMEIVSNIENLQKQLEDLLDEDWL
jgi:type I restriction enzyme M protein